MVAVVVVVVGVVAMVGGEVVGGVVASGMQVRSFALRVMMAATGVTTRRVCTHITTASFIISSTLIDVCEEANNQSFASEGAQKYF